MFATLDQRYVGCILGAAVGDALGWPLEDLTAEAFGQARIPTTERAGGGVEALRRYVPVDGRPGVGGSTTQLLLFTAEGLLRAHNRLSSDQPADPAASVHRAYLRWLDTQRLGGPPPRADGWLAGLERLYARRARTTTTLQALRTGLMGRPDQPINNAREAAPLARIAPVALTAGWEPFALGRQVAALTHGHAHVQLAAGALARLLQELVLGTDFSDAIDATWAELEPFPDAKPLLEAMDNALDMADLGDPSASRVASFGEGRDPLSAMAIALYCTASTDSFGDGVGLAVLHTGASDWTGAITGALCGARAGSPGIPQALRDELDLREIVVAVANDLHRHFATGDFEPDEEDWNRYPG